MNIINTKKIIITCSITSFNGRPFFCNNVSVIGISGLIKVASTAADSDVLCSLPN